MSSIVESLYRISLNESIAQSDVANFGRALADKINSISNIYTAEFLDIEDLLVIRSDLTNKIIYELPIKMSTKEVPIFTAISKNMSINFDEGKDLEHAAGLVIDNLKYVVKED